MKKILFLITALLIQLSAWADPGTAPTVGDGSAANPYQIATTANFTWFAAQVNDSHNTGICAILKDNITLTWADGTVGTNAYPYTGTFDGDGHIITLDYTVDCNNAAPFSFINGATIKNFSLTGTIKTNYQYTGSVVGQCGGNISTLSSICSDVRIETTFVGDAYEGGLIGNVNGSCNITHCSYGGNINTSLASMSSIHYYAGMVGKIDNATLSVKDSYVIASKIRTGETARSFVASINSGNLEMDNCYYIGDNPASSVSGSEQGTYLESTTCMNGELCYKLNKGVTDGTQAWYQTLISNSWDVEQNPYPNKTGYVKNVLGTLRSDTDHKTVYSTKEGACPSTQTYSNSLHSGKPADFNSDGLKACTNSKCKYVYECEVPTANADGYYEISKIGHLIWFAEQVNAGNTKYNAKLTDDIDLTGYECMIGTSSSKYGGIFDGNGHTVTVVYTATEKYTGLFRYVKDATIKNLTTAGSISTAYQFAAGIVAFSEGTTNISNSQSSVAITSAVNGDGSHGGIVADNEGTMLNLTNILFNGKLLGSQTNSCGGMIGWTKTGATLKGCLLAPSADVTVSSSYSHNFSRGYNLSLTDCYYTIALNGILQGEEVTSDMVTSGEVCYMLNGKVSDETVAWRQNLTGDTTDSMPVLDTTHSIVYGGEMACPSTSTYSNVSHTLSYNADGFATCSTCNAVTSSTEPATLVAGSTDTYLINNKGNFLWFAEQVNNGKTSINGRLTTNINLGDNQTMIGTETNKYGGTFDGCGNTITVNYTAKANYTALFRYVNGATINNLITAGTISTAYYQFVAGIVARSEGTTDINNCQSSVAITSTVNGDGTHGGIVADNEGSAVNLTNVLFNGQLLGEETTSCGGLIGWTLKSATITNCLFAPSAAVTFSSSLSKNFSRGNNITITNSYYTADFSDAQDTEEATSTMQTSGELCYKLNGDTSTGDLAWYQTISGDTKDDIPYPFISGHSIVYGGTDACPYSDGTTFSNKTHTITYNSSGEGSCSDTNCHSDVSSVQAPTTGDGSTSNPYQIANKGNLIWFANQVNAGQNTINAKLTADIDLGTSQAMIGIIKKDEDNTINYSYAGIFDGDNHTVTVNYTPSENVAALFRYVDGATIKNLCTTGSISTTKTCKQLAGIAGMCGVVTLDHVHSDVTINSTYNGDSSDGGLVADISGTSTISNSYFDGKLLGSSTQCCGGLIGWIADAHVTINNSYVNIQEITVNTSECKTFARGGNNLTLNNCFYVTALGTTQGTQVSTEEVANGGLCYKLNGSTSTGTLTWYQNVNNGATVDAKPVWDSTHGIVYGENVCPSTLSYSNNQHSISDTSVDGIKGCTNEGCTYASSFDAPTTGDGTESSPYQIANKGNLIWFANQVNAGNTAYNAKLTVDIDLGTNQAMIGTSTNKYAGTFDGDNHTITVNYTPTENVAALFRYVDGATIKYLGTTGTITTTSTNKGKQLAGIAGICGAVTIDHVHSNVTINSAYSGDSSDGGLVAEVSNTSTISNSYFDGKLLGSSTTCCGGLVGWIGDASLTINSSYVNIQEISVSTSGCKKFARGGDNLTLNNSCYVNAPGSEQGIYIASEGVAAGALCYALNGYQTTSNLTWYQTIGRDAAPVWDNAHGKVYGGADACPTTIGFSNKTHTSTQEEDGYTTCSECGGIVIGSAPETEVTTDGRTYYIIKNKGNFLWFANQVNTGKNVINARLNANIDLGTLNVVIGTSAYPYSGRFNGDYHTITIGYNVNMDNLALFSYMNDATVKNLNVAGTISTSGKYAGGVAGYMQDQATLQNVMSSVAITNTVTEKTYVYCGGLAGYMGYNSTIENSAFTGKLLGEHASDGGQLVGYVNDWDNYINSCYANASSVTMQNIDAVLTCDEDAEDVEAINCYYITGTSDYGTKVPASELASGALCWKLNSGKTTDLAWYQKLGTDDAPVWDSTHGVVYGGTSACPSTSAYSNTTHTIAADGAFDANGEKACSATGCEGKSFEPATFDGDECEYVIANRGNLIWLANQVNTGASLRYWGSARLETDIDLGNNQTMIANKAHPYDGVFYGENHTIKVNYNTTEDYAALFRYCNNDCYINDLRVSGTITTSGKYAAGIAAHIDDGTEIDCCHSNVTINSTVTGAGYHGGIAAYADYMSIEDCIFSGSFNGTNTTTWGGIVGYAVERCYLDNCVFAPTSVSIASDDTNSATIAVLSNPNKNTYNDGCYYTTTLGYTTDDAKDVSAKIGNGSMIGDELDIAYWYQDNTLNIPVPLRKYYDSVILSDDEGIQYDHSFADVAGYIREMSSTSNFGTLVLPFEVESNEYVQLYTLSSVTTGENGVMTFEKVDKVTANTPCVFKKLTADANNVTFGAYNQYLDYAASPSTEPCTGWTMNGTYTNLTDQTGMYFIAQDKFWKADAAITIKPFRGWFAGPSEAKSMIINIEDDDTNQILTIDADGSIIEGPVYNLNGQKLNNPKRGVNIINGKKIIVK